MYVKKKLFREITKHLTARANELNSAPDRKGKAKQIREIYAILYEIDPDSRNYKCPATNIFKQLEINIQ